jgi:hypothetical protein
VLAWFYSGVLFFYVGGPCSSGRSGEATSDIGCIVPQPFATGRNRSYLNF